MKLTNKQSLAVAEYLIHSDLIKNYYLRELGELFDGDIKELRVIHRFGAAGKIWNNNGRIYVTGWGHSEISANEYQKQQGQIDEINRIIAEIIELYK